MAESSCEILISEKSEFVIRPSEESMGNQSFLSQLYQSIFVSHVAKKEPPALYLYESRQGAQDDEKQAGAEH